VKQVMLSPLPAAIRNLASHGFNQTNPVRQNRRKHTWFNCQHLDEGDINMKLFSVILPLLMIYKTTFTTNDE